MFPTALAALFPVLLSGLGPEPLPSHNFPEIHMNGVQRLTGVCVVEWMPCA